MTNVVIDPKKQYRTRDDREVRIYAVDGRSGEEVHGAYLTKDGWVPFGWDKSGLWCDGSEDKVDLIEVKPRIQRKVWVNVYPHRMGVPHGNHAYVAMHRGKDAIACVEIDIDVEEGHGL